MHALRSARPRIVRRLHAVKVSTPVRSYADKIVSVWCVTVPMGIAGMSVGMSYRAFRDEEYDECKAVAATAGFLQGLFYGAAVGAMTPFVPVAIPVVAMLDHLFKKSHE